jgi:hypothetical protein
VVGLGEFTIALKIVNYGWAQWLTLVILPIWEAKSKRIVVQGQPEQKAPISTNKIKYPFSTNKKAVACHMEGTNRTIIVQANLSINLRPCLTNN